MKIETLTTWSPWGLYITSGDSEDDKPDCKLVVYGFHKRVEIWLPQIIRPHSIKLFPDWDAVTIARLGRDYYIHYTRRDYGFLVNDDHLSVFLGRQTHDSSTEQSWGCFLPWRSWRFVRHSLYGLRGERLWTQLERKHVDFDIRREEELLAHERTPKTHFLFLDFDGEEIEATTMIEEREWHFGTSWCSWLSLFRKPKVVRALDIRFNKETGPRKGSWKGGTLGHGIEMEPDELHHDAFKRYCAKHNMTLLVMKTPARPMMK